MGQTVLFLSFNVWLCDRL